MTIDIKVPAMGESVTEATVGRWFKQQGDAVSRDEPLLELETDKVTVEVPAPADGALQSIAVKTGETVQVGSLLGSIAEGAAANIPAAKQPAVPLRESPPASNPSPIPVRQAVKTPPSARTDRLMP